MASTDPANDEQKQIFAQERRARALYVSGTGHHEECRELNVVIWACWADNFPACVKRRHYERGFSALLWWSGNDVCTDGNWMKWGHIVFVHCYLQSMRSVGLHHQAMLLSPFQNVSKWTYLVALRF
eukprot:831967-Pyramimonas_sp.AAC.1